ncbi:hypothetical protein LUZ60_013603 [Juncus effusus]|nr:hypothetical protein LUZ60_013603 [Juncus effusus]
MISNRGRSNNDEYDSYRNWVTRSDDGGLYHWRVSEERARTCPHGLSRFHSQQYSPGHIRILDEGGNIGPEDNINPRLRRFIQNSLPRISSEWNLRTTPEQEDPGLTENEFKSAMKQLKKHVYQPSYPPEKAYKRSKSESRRKEIELEVEKHEEEKDCSICLEAFTRNEQVLVTPCQHMFHSDCITPWVKSHGNCPLALDLIALIRAMEDAFNWVTLDIAFF